VQFSPAVSGRRMPAVAGGDRIEAVVAGRGDACRRVGGTKGGKMPLKDEIRLKAELRAATVLLSALMRQTDAQDLRQVFEDAVVRETAHMLERGARSEAIRAFEDAAGEWAIRSRRSVRLDGNDGDGGRRRTSDRSQRH
jgi:hypothetical protein